jgi:putative transposase
VRHQGGLGDLWSAEMMGYREILGVRVTECENEKFWSGLFEDLTEQGLTGVRLVISDGHTGIQKATKAAFLDASWQHCTRAVLENIPQIHLKEIAEGPKEAYEDEQRL